MSPLLSALPIQNITPEALDFLTAHVHMQHMKNNEILLAPGMVCENAYFVVQGGFVCRFIDAENATGKTINFYLPDIHPFMGCIDSFFTQTPTQCELRSISDSVVLHMKKKDLDTLLEMDAVLLDFYWKTVITALREENDLKLKIIAYSSEQLYRYFMETFPAVIQYVPSKYIAELMGISPEWLSKLKRPR